MNTYSPQRYDALHEFEVAYAAYPSFSDVIWHLGDVICTHGLEDIVGVSLLHKHFELSSQERLLRHYADAHCLIGPSPQHENQVPCVWAISTLGDLLPVEFADTHGLPESIAQADALVTHTEFLADIARVLAEHNAENMFGLATLAGIQFLNPGVDETVLEKNDGERQLKLNIILTETLKSIDSAQTLWRFSRRDEPGKFACPISRPESAKGLGAHCYHCCGCLNPNFHK